MSTPAPQLYEKRCPTCGTGAMLDAGKCIICGHVFRTQFDTSISPTLPVQQPSYQQPWQQGYQPPEYQTPPMSPVQQQPQQPWQAQPPYGYPPIAYQPGVIQKIPGVHSVATAVIIGLLITGGGQFVNGQIGKGIVTIVAVFLLALPTFFVGPVIIGILALIDAILIAQRLHRGEAVREWQCF